MPKRFQSGLIYSSSPKGASICFVLRFTISYQEYFFENRANIKSRKRGSGHFGWTLDKSVPLVLTCRLLSLFGILCVGKIAQIGKRGGQTSYNNICKKLKPRASQAIS